MTGPYQGSCLCGEIRFEADDFEPHNGHCHCSMCRKFHGAAYSTLAAVRRDHFRWLAGEHLLKFYVADNGTTRGFCSNCGSSLTFAAAADRQQIIEIALGCFDQEVPLEPDAHIFIGSGATWAAPADDLPQYEAGRDSERIK